MNYIYYVHFHQIYIDTGMYKLGLQRCIIFKVFHHVNYNYHHPTYVCLYSAILVLLKQIYQAHVKFHVCQDIIFS